METSIKLSVLLSINTENNMKNNFTMPDVVLDLTDENKDIFEAIAQCEAKRQDLLHSPWYKRIFKPVKRSLKK